MIDVLSPEDHTEIGRSSSKKIAVGKNLETFCRISSILECFQ